MVGYAKTSTSPTSASVPSARAELHRAAHLHDQRGLHGDLRALDDHRAASELDLAAAPLEGADGAEQRDHRGLHRVVAVELLVVEAADEGGDAAAGALVEPALGEVELGRRRGLLLRPADLLADVAEGELGLHRADVLR